MLYCNLRPQETAPLRWSDVDFDNRRIKITKALESDTGEVSDTKTKSGVRSVPIPVELFYKLKAIAGKSDELIFPTYNLHSRDCITRSDDIPSKLQ